MPHTSCPTQMETSLEICSEWKRLLYIEARAETNREPLPFIALGTIASYDLRALFTIGAAMQFYDTVWWYPRSPMQSIYVLSYYSANVSSA